MIKYFTTIVVALLMAVVSSNVFGTDFDSDAAFFVACFALIYSCREKNA